MMYAKLQKPEVIALDLDQTIHDVVYIYEERLNDTRTEFGLKKLSNKEIDKLYKNGFIAAFELFKVMFKERSEEALKYYFNLLHEYKFSDQKLVGGSKELLKTIKNLGLKTVAVTNSEQHIAKKILRDMCILNYFDAVTGVKPNRKLKPNPEILLISLSKINKKPGKNIWFMGDSATDTICAKHTNCTSIRFFHTEKPPSDPNADIFFNSHYDFIETIKHHAGDKKHIK